MQTIFTNESTNEIALMLLNNGFDIIQHKETDNWFTYHKDGKLAYYQYDRIEGPTISTVHKPNKQTGTGYRLIQIGKEQDYIQFETTVQCFEKGFATAPHWVRSAEVSTIVKWASLEEYLKNEKILKYTLIEKFNK